MKFRAAMMGLLAVGVIAGAAMPAVVLAQSPAKVAVDAGKAAGRVGEQGDGFLGIVSGGDATLQAAVREINAGRARVYAETAAKTGVTPDAAAQAAARELIERLPPGQYYKPLGGNWTRK